MPRLHEQVFSRRSCGSACLGDAATNAATRNQVMAMLASVRITTRPPADVPVADAAQCAAGQVSVEVGPWFGSISQTSGLAYAIHNSATRTCALDGYPQVQLYAGARPLAVNYHYGGGPYAPPATDQAHRVYLRPGAYAEFLVSQYRCDLVAPGVNTKQSTGATSVTIALPGQSTVTRLPATDRLGRSGIASCGGTSPNTVYINAITGN